MTMMLDQQERRGEPRRRVAWQGRLLLAEGQETCEVKNLSCTGVHVTSRAELEIGSEVSLEIESLGGFSGCVAWRDEHHYGVRFQEFSTIIWQFIGCLSSFENMSARRGI